MYPALVQYNIVYNTYDIVDVSKTDILNKKYTIVADCYIQTFSKTQQTSGEPFIRLRINGTVIFEGNGVTGAYKYICSPIFPVRKGDVVQYTLTTDTTDGYKEFRIYSDNM